MTAATDRESSSAADVHALLAVAGAVDALMFLHAGDLLAVYMTGNTTKLGQAVTRFDLQAASGLLLVIASFVAATTGAAWLGTHVGRSRPTTTLAIVALFLAAAQGVATAKYSLATVALIAAAMGALNQVLSNEPGVTFVTGTLVLLGRALCAGKMREALGLGLRWVAFFAGAVVATGADERLRAPVLGLVAATVGAAGTYGAIRRSR